MKLREALAEAQEKEKDPSLPPPPPPPHDSLFKYRGSSKKAKQKTSGQKESAPKAWTIYLPGLGGRSSSN